MAANVADEQQTDLAATGTTIANATPIVLAVGDFAEISVTLDSGASDSVTCTGVTASDGAGHTPACSSVKHVNSADNQSLTVFKSVQITVAGSYTFTGALSATTPFRGIKVKRIAGSSGLDTNAPAGQVSSFIGIGTDAVTSGNVTPSVAGALISSICLCTHGGGPTITKGTGFTDGLTSWPTVGPCHTESLHVSATTAKAATYTSNQNNVFIVIAVVWLDVSSVINTKTIDETMSIGDAIAALLQRVRQIIDNLFVTDSATKLLQLARSALDSISIADTETRLVLATRAIADSIVMTDTLLKGGNQIRALLEAIAVGDFETALQMHTRIVAETIPAITDAATRSRLVGRVLADVLAVTDAEQRLVLATRLIADSFTAADLTALSAYRPRSLLDTIAIADSQVGQKIKVRNLLDAMLLSDSQLTYKLLSRAATEGISIADAIARLTNSRRSIAEAIAILDSQIGIYIPASGIGKPRVSEIVLGSRTDVRIDERTGPQLSALAGPVLAARAEPVLGSREQATQGSLN